jgi:hypothetical protein
MTLDRMTLYEQLHRDLHLLKTTRLRPTNASEVCKDCVVICLSKQRTSSFITMPPLQLRQSESSMSSLHVLAMCLCIYIYIYIYIYIAYRFANEFFVKIKKNSQAAETRVWSLVPWLSLSRGGGWILNRVTWLRGGYAIVSGQGVVVSQPWSLNS